MAWHQLKPSDYFTYNDLPKHHGQGDVYERIPFVQAETFGPDFSSEGVREMAVMPVEGVFTGILMSYTCNIVAQPPGTLGYSHPFRLLAPVFPFPLASEAGLSDATLEKIQTHDNLRGFMYLPPDGVCMKEASVALLYRPALMMASVLNSADRLGRFSYDACRVLLVKLVEFFTGKTLRVDTFDPDMSDSWGEVD